MEWIKKELYRNIEEQKEILCAMSDDIFDHPEGEGNEVRAAKVLTDYLKDNGFQVEMGTGGFETAFRAEYSNGEGGPSIGILCEYDALKGLGHGCGHHMQGPSCLGAAVAVKKVCREKPFRLIVYGTPGEETLSSKCDMAKKGCFKDIDIALMVHGASNTSTDIRSMAYLSYRVIYHGKSSHAATAPEDGRSAFDALLLAFQGVEFLRKHVPDDTRMHYTMLELPGPVNVIPERAAGKFSLRSFSMKNLEGIGKRFENIIKGASLMAGAEYEIELTDCLYNKIPVMKINDLLMENAELSGAPKLAPPREKTGSTDFGNVMYDVPGSCIRVAMAPEGTPLHSQEFVNSGKTEEAHDAIIYGAKTIAGTAWDVISKEGLLDEIQEEFMNNKELYQ